MSAESKINSLKDDLSDWIDIDFAQHCLAVCIGLVKDDSKMRDYKAIYWSDNIMGNLLAKMLDDLVELGCLEKRDEPDWQYRWNPKVDDAFQLYDSDVRTESTKKDSE